MAVGGRHRVTKDRPGTRKLQPAGCSDLPTADLARLREATYRLLSQALLYPDTGRLRHGAQAAGELTQEGDALARFAFFGDWNRLLAVLRDVDPLATPGLQETYVALFAVDPAGVPCPPYESFYREPSGQPTGLLIAQVEAAYAVVGLEASSELAELPDHVAIELEFMALLCGREAEAWENEDAPRAAEAMRRAKRFLNSHLSLWLPAFNRRVAAADTSGFYRAASEGAQAFVMYDKDFLAALLDELPADAVPAGARSNGSRPAS